MSIDKIERLETLAKPLVNLLREQYNPHCQIIIESGRVRIVEDVVGVPAKEDSHINFKPLKQELDQDNKVFQVSLNGGEIARSVIRGTQV